ncbi:hypothetical protein D3C84_655190 [compost metagenome]
MNRLDTAASLQGIGDLLHAILIRAQQHHFGIRRDGLQQSLIVRHARIDEDDFLAAAILDIRHRASLGAVAGGLIRFCVGGLAVGGGGDRISARYIAGHGGGNRTVEHHAGLERTDQRLRARQLIGVRRLGQLSVVACSCRPGFSPPHDLVPRNYGAITATLGWSSVLAIDALGFPGSPDHMSLAAARVLPEVEPGVLFKQVGRQDGATRLDFHLGPHLVQSFQTERLVEFWRVVFDMLEIMLEPGFSEEVVDQTQHLLGRRRQ